jgi:hypothetical protein
MLLGFWRDLVAWGGMGLLGKSKDIQDVLGSVWEKNFFNKRKDRDKFQLTTPLASRTATA